MTLEPIGFVLSGGGVYPQEAPRQAVFADNEGVVELLPGCNYEQALKDLSGFERVWLIFLFHRNTGWKPMVQPPHGSSRKRGVFATRSPHRPNPIGISAVELIKIEGRKLFIRNFDLLDGTPILDIKPYIPAADAFPEAKAGWRDEMPQPGTEPDLSPAAEEAAAWIRANGGPDLKNIIHVQLGTREVDAAKQRITRLPDGSFIFAFRTWRVTFTPGNPLKILSIASGYTPEELAENPDPYGDKALHRRFRNSRP